MEKNKKKFTWITIVLIILISIRIIGNGIIIVYSNNLISFVVFFIFIITYVLCLAGIVSKRKFGVILTSIAGIIDLIASLALGGATGVGAGIFDIILLILSYKEYKSM